MQVHELKTKFKTRKEKRVGRGGKRGTTSGRGQKGQKARAGHSLKPAERDLIQRLPKLRGSKNKRKSESALVIPVGKIEALAKDGKLTLQILVAQRVIKKITVPVKIVSQGSCTSPIIITGVPISAAAREKIVKAGGTVNES